AGHEEIEEDHVDPCPASQVVERLARARELGDLVTFLAEGLAQAVADVGIVVDDEDLRGAWHLRVEIAEYCVPAQEVVPGRLTPRPGPCSLRWSASHASPGGPGERRGNREHALAPQPGLERRLDRAGAHLWGVDRPHPRQHRRDRVLR